LTYIGHSEGTTQFFLGASLVPEYFTSKVNLFVGLAPVASTANIPSHWLRESAKFIREIEFALMEAKIYNLFPPMPDALLAEEFFCTLPYLKNVCKDVMKIFHHEGVDDPKAGETFLSNEPSGQSWRTFAYYA
jgi:lysosomal acid lipase/cholesteryl ester hydrolase